MIQVEGQFVAKFNIGPFKDFIGNNDLILFVIDEEAGNTLPKFELIFTVGNTQIMGYFNQGNVVEVSLGKTEVSLINIRIRIMHTVIKRAGDEKREVRITGFYDALPYLVNASMKAFPSVTGVETIKEVAKKHFKKLDFNIEKSKDTPQTWLQPNISDRLFVNDVWVHSYMPNSFIMVGISSDGTFVLKDMKTALKQSPKYKWRLVDNPKGGNELAYHSDYTLDSESAISNLWSGYGRSGSVLDSDSGDLSTTSQNIKPMVAQTKTMDRDSTVSTKVDSFSVQNENVHSQYANAYWQNLSNLAMFGSTKMVLRLVQRFEHINVLDFVMFAEQENDDGESSEFNSGLYIVSKVVTTLMAKNVSIVLELNRESFNMMSGNLT